jgi:hypothetical protein
MWMGVTYVDPNRSPVIHEGVAAAQVVVMNAGPGFVDLLVWQSAGPTPATASIVMRLRPGDTRAASGPMIGLKWSDDQAGITQQFAAVGWSIVP